jgi:hypothetical protein
MTSTHVRRTGAVPAPRSAEPPTEPQHTARAARPRTQYWDYRTASWRSSDPVAAPRSSG